MDREDLTDIQEEFRDEAGELLESEDDFDKSSEEVSVGFEQEYVIYTSEGELDDGTLQRELKEEFAWADSEVGQPMIELDIGPIRLEDWGQAETAIREAEQAAQSFLGERGFLARHGAIPDRDIPEYEINDSEKAPDRYQELVEEFERKRERETFGDDVPLSAKIVGGITGTQINWQAENFEAGVEKHNYMYQVGRSVAALSGHSPMIGGKETGFKNSRLPGWMAAFNPTEDEQREQKVGPLEEYPEDVKEILENRHLDHTEAEDPLAAAQGEDWKYVRSKLELPSSDEDTDEPEDYQMILEGRIPGMQPTAAEDVALAAFQIGWSHYAFRNGVERLSIESVNRDYQEAFEHGLDAQLTEREEEGEVMKDAEAVIRKELDEARRGLEDLGLDDGYLDLLEARLDTGETPSDAYKERVMRYSDSVPYDEALVLALPKVSRTDNEVGPDGI